MQGQIQLYRDMSKVPTPHAAVGAVRIARTGQEDEDDDDDWGSGVTPSMRGGRGYAAEEDDMTTGGAPEHWASGDSLAHGISPRRQGLLHLFPCCSPAAALLLPCILLSFLPFFPSVYLKPI
jgi:hypothetical protein